MKFIAVFLFVLSTLFANIHNKSAVVYYGENISYPMVGVHDYIIVQPNHINTTKPGFDIYKDKIYAYVSIGEIDRTIPEYKYVKKEWIAAENKFWSSDALDIKNKEYQKFLFEHMIDPLLKRGFKNLFFDTLDSYNLYSKNEQERQANERALATFIHSVHKKYPNVHIIVNRGFEIIDMISNDIQAVLFESYYNGLSGDKKDPYKKVSQSDREWLDIWLDKIRSHGIDIISVEYMDPKDIYAQNGKKLVQKIEAKGMIPFLSNKDLSLYGRSSKEVVKREVFTLIDEKKLDRTFLASHEYGAVILEYLGYKQYLYDINKGLPNIEKMHHYAGVVIWLSEYQKNAKKLLKWVNKLIKTGMKVVFVNNFGVEVNDKVNLKKLGIKLKQNTSIKVAIAHRDAMIHYEIDPPLYNSLIQVTLEKGEALLTYKYADGSSSTPAALTPWGGYIVDDSVMVGIDDQNLWIVDPYKFFTQALRLDPLPIGDVTTENGKRLLFSHVDGDGLANRVEGDFGKYAGDVILNKILRVYKIPHSISVIGADIDPHGPFAKYHDELVPIVKAIYALPNVEGATHTYSHPFMWEKIINGNLDPQYRIKVKGYKFSLKHELIDTLENINTDYYPSNKQPKARTVFWSGNCSPHVNALSFLYKHKLLNINGGYTAITNTQPWLSLIAPLGLERDGYVQIYTGAQNENVYTDNWTGPFWQFKKVLQTFKLTNSPRRYKPIDIYYHLYSGSKQASYEVLKDVFDWAIKQDVMPIFTSEYIPKVIEFYNYSLAKGEDGEYLFAGLQHLNTIRVEKKDFGVDYKRSKTVAGVKHFEGHTYYALAKAKQHYFKPQKEIVGRLNYLISANAHLTSYKELNEKTIYDFSGYVPLKMEFAHKKGCVIDTMPKADFIQEKQHSTVFEYKNDSEAKVVIQCSQIF